MGKHPPIPDSEDETTEAGHGECPRHRKPYRKHRVGVGTRPVILTSCDDCDAEKAEESAKEGQRERERQHQRGLAEANIPSRYGDAKLTNYITATQDQRVTLQLVQDFVHPPTDRPPNTVGLLFIGGLGTGKTHLACAALHEVIQKPGDGLYMGLQRAIRRVKATWAKDSRTSEQQELDRLARVGLLVLDEMGVQYGSETERMLLTEIVNDRYNAERPTILVSNLTLPEFTQTVGERVVDRFREGGRVVVFDWPSHRPKSGRRLIPG